MNQAVVVEAVRTPIGRAHPERGMFRDVRADDLSADLMKALLRRARVTPDLIEDIHWGCVKQVGEQGYNVARQAALIAGFPVEITGQTVNRNCGSSLQAIHSAAHAILAGCEDVQIAGGVEHMHHCPMEAGIDPSSRYQARHGADTLNMGLTAEFLGRKFGIDRRSQDEFALRSHLRAAQAGDEGHFADEIEPTWGRNDAGQKMILTHDQCIRRDSTLEALSALKPVFQPSGGTVTAGNASPINVGAAAVLMMSDAKAKAFGLRPWAKIRSTAVAGVDPSVMGIGPVPATLKALERAKLSLSDIGLIEINEAFAVQALAVIRLLKADPERVNVQGGALAIGHPLGASGARIATTLLHAMRRRSVRFGLATMCIGAGQGIATVFELLE